MARKFVMGAILGSLCAVILVPTPALAVDRVSATEKGSIVIFSKVEIRWAAPNWDVIQDTFLDLANDYPADVRIQLYFINGDEELLEIPGVERYHPGCNWVDNQITLTGNEPTYWSALTGMPKGVSPFTILDPGFPPGRPDPEGSTDRVLRGLVIAWAVDASDGEEIRWNHLKGDALIVNYINGSAWEYNGWTFRATDAVAHGAKTGTPGVLNLDGVEFDPCFDLLLLDFYAVGSMALSHPAGLRLVQVNTDLTMFPVDRDMRQETDGPVTTKAAFVIWNMNEVMFTNTHRCVTCWDQALLSSYGWPNSFLLGNLHTDKGKARIDGIASALCPDSVDAALLGVAMKLLDFDGGVDFAQAGMNLFGMGTQDAVMKADIIAPPPPEQPGQQPGREFKRFRAEMIRPVE